MIKEKQLKEFQVVVGNVTKHKTIAIVIHYCVEMIKSI